MSFLGSLGAPARVLHPCRGIAGTVTGQAGALGAALADPLGVASALAVDVVEVGATGWYTVEFTPDQAGLWRLAIANPAFPTADGVTTDYVVDVRAGLVPGTGLLTTLDRVKRRAGIDWTTDDAMLLEIIGEVSGRIEHLARRTFAEADRTFYVDGTGRATLVLPDGPIAAVALVEELVWSEAVTATVLDAWRYRIRNPRGAGGAGAPELAQVERMDGGTWATGRARWRVTATVGYDVIPESLAGDATLLAIWRWRVREVEGLRSSTEGDGSVDPLTPAELDMQFERVAARWRWDWGL